jgi:hypothetical protein
MATRIDLTTLTTHSETTSQDPTPRTETGDATDPKSGPNRTASSTVQGPGFPGVATQANSVGAGVRGESDAESDEEYDTTGTTGGATATGKRKVCIIDGVGRVAPCVKLATQLKRPG